MSGLEILCVGQAVVDCITRKIEDDPHGAGKRIAESITLNVGGDAVNEAAALAGMGRRAGLVCGLGDDHAGRMILEEMRRKGVSTEYVNIRPKLRTPVADIIVGADGSRSSVSSRQRCWRGMCRSCRPQLQHQKDMVSESSPWPASSGRPSMIPG